MSRPPADFSLPANLLKALWPLLTLSESGLVLALDELLAGKMFFFAAHRITRTGRSGSGPKKRSRMESSPPWRTSAPRSPVFTVTPRYARLTRNVYRRSVDRALDPWKLPPGGPESSSRLSAGSSQS